MGYKDYRPYHNPSKLSQICRKCKRQKPATHFWKEPRKKNGLRSTCRRCEKKRNAVFTKSDERFKIYEKNKQRRRLPKYRYATTVGRARRKNVIFAISLKTYTRLLEQACHYCHGRLNETSCGLDRMDNSKGYLFDNVVPCCKECNEIKGDTLTYVEALVAIKALTDYRKRKEDFEHGLSPYSELVQESNNTRTR